MARKGFKKNFSIRPDGKLSPISGASSQNQMSDWEGYSNWGNNLPDVYTGHPNRIQRYQQFESMNLDGEVSGALDIIADFCTQTSSENNTAFTIETHEKISDNELAAINQQMRNWYNLQSFDDRLFRLVRNTCLYGDQIMLRDPQTYELFWCDMNKVTKVVVNESQGKEPEQYFLRDIDPNFETLTVSGITTNDQYLNGPNQGGSSGYVQPNSSSSGGGRFSQDQTEKAIDARHVVHFSLSEGMDPNWPFGSSILEAAFKTFKQKELLEDAILIYRIQRAPERRVFYIGTGTLPPHLQRQFVERVKNEIKQRRVPSRTGGGESIMDATYNPISINEDFFFPQPENGNGSRVETLPGGQNLDQIEDLKFFSNKLLRSLRVPSSYLPSGTDDGSQSYTDGRVATALIQEHRFNQYCRRLQRSIEKTLDREFKMFLAWRGFDIDSASFEINLNPPLNFAKYREIDLYQSQIGNFTSLDGVAYLSKRFLLEKYLGLSESEIAKNESMLLEERNQSEGQTAEGGDLRNVGVSGGSMSSDLDALDDFDDGDFDEISDDFDESDDDMSFDMPDDSGDDET